LAISRDRKKELVEEYAEQLESCQGLILTDYRGLQVTDMEQLRRDLRQQNIKLQVVKNRLLQLALEGKGMEVPGDWLQGPTAVAYCYDEVQPAAKALNDFAKDSDSLSIKGGVTSAAILTAEQVATLADLPSREVLFAQVLGGINAPASRATSAVAGGIRQVLNVLQAYVDKMEGESPAAQAA